MELKEARFVTEIVDQEILLSMKTLCSLYAGTCPLTRDLGISIDIISQSIDIAQTVYAQDIMDQVEKFIPEVEVTEVELLIGAKGSGEETDGTLYPVIYFRKKEEGEIEPDI